MYPKVCVLPISGQQLTGQLGICLALTEKGYRPEVTMGTSGGALVGAWGVKTDWNSTEWRRQILQIQDTRFFAGHPLFRLTKGSLYTPGPGLESLYQMVTPHTSEEILRFRRNELIINAYNNTYSRTDIFSTHQPRPTWPYLNTHSESCNVPDHLYSEYMEEILRATSAVPVVLPEVPMNGSFYSDGGTAYVSPLNLVQTSLDILYVSPYNFDIPSPTRPTNRVIKIFDDTYSQSVRSNFIQERYTYFQTMGFPTQSYTGDMTTLDRVLTQTVGQSRFVCLYPTEPNNLSLTRNYSRDIYFQSIFSAERSYSYIIYSRPLDHKPDNTKIEPEVDSEDTRSSCR